MSRNPFNQLYVGERVSPHEFVAIFSRELVDPATALFERGNVVLAGVQGTGKSMLLKLFSPEIRIAYADAEVDFPVPLDSPRFVAASINVNTARCNQFGRRRPPPGDYQQEIMFADFLNYYICIDLLQSVAKLYDHEGASAALDLRFPQATRDALASEIGRDPVWRGYLNGINTMDALIGRLGARIQGYRDYLSSPFLPLDPEIDATRTPLGDPMEAVVAKLRGFAALPDDVEVYALVDQYEELGTITDPARQKADYRGVVNSLMNRRDAQVSYRVGTRGYGWRHHTGIFGTDARIEQDRDYKLVDLDAVLKRYEDPATNIFPAFARAVFERRVAYHVTADRDPAVPKTLNGFLGKSESASQKAAALAGSKPDNYLNYETNWPEEVREALRSLATADPIDAKLGEIWCRQKGAAERIADQPWRKKQYWVKERAPVALLRIAGLRKQRVMYAGEEDVVALSGANILTFLSLCQHIWKNAVQARTRRSNQVPFPVATVVQTIAIFECGIWWLDRIPGEYGRGADRHRFVERLGQVFNASLAKDAAMSNPGHFGFSLTYEDLADNQDVRDLLEETVDFGNLTRREHTTKSPDRKRRVKFYLNPVYCPIYRLPFAQIKEPVYVTTAQVRRWMHEAGVSGAATLTDPPRPTERKHRAGSKTLPLLAGLEDLGG